MQAVDIQSHARCMLEAQGPRAIAEAAQKAKTLEAQGAGREAHTWRRIEAALRLMQGPRES